MLWPSELIDGQSYDLQLPNGSILRGAVYRGEIGVLSTPKGQKTMLPIFDVQGIGNAIPIENFAIVMPPTPRPWVLMLGVNAGMPLNQGDLGFEQSLSGDVKAVVPVFLSLPAIAPSVALQAGFLRLSGKFALLSGPEVLAGPSWLFGLGSKSHNLYLDATAGVGFYRLYNERVKRTFSQNTLVAQAQLGYLFRSHTWGFLLSWAQGFMYDKNRPLYSSGVHLAAIWQGGNS